MLSNRVRGREKASTQHWGVGRSGGSRWNTRRGTRTMPRYLPISTPSRHIGGARDGDDLYGQRDDIHFIKARIAGLPTQKGYLSLGWPPFPTWHSMSRESASALVE